MDFRSRRQLAVLAVVALVAGGGLFLLLRASLPEPSCQDNRRNQGEEEVDCGGPCISCTFRARKDVEIYWVRFVKVRENTYDVAAEIRNPNVRLGAVRLEYEIKLFDTAGAAVVIRPGVSFLYSGETAHLAEVGLTSGRTIRDVALKITRVHWVLSEALSPDLIAGSKEYSEEEDHGQRVSVVRTIVSNRTTREITDAMLSVLALDAAGNLIGVHRTVLKTLPAGRAQEVRLAWPGRFSLSVSSLIIEARSPALLPAAEQP